MGGGRILLLLKKKNGTLVKITNNIQKRKAHLRNAAERMMS